MAGYPYHQTLRLENFTAFKDTKFEFVPGINAFIGENGTGKTHVMKALYAFQRTASHSQVDFQATLAELFQTRNTSIIVRLGSDTAIAIAQGRYNDVPWNCRVKGSNGSAGFGDGTGYGGGSASGAGNGDGTGSGEGPHIGAELNYVASSAGNIERPVFIPAIDMIGHTRGFLQAASQVVLDFDLTCTDLVALLGLERRNSDRQTEVVTGLSDLLGGQLDYEENTGRFYLVTARGRLPIPLVAEGLRKIATLVRLAQNGWITPGTTLFWDEPEVNLNPVLMDEVIATLLTIARAGIQVFIATHSYVILKELDLQSKPTDNVRYFAFQPHEDGTMVNATDDFALLEPNPILQQYDSLYDRELTRATGRNRNGESVR